ncbi:MAG: methionyl-tRNA formyltransferase [Alphaproteobacteria bacterium]|nr:MAG: methionyl-tRNA formyltransferase [Alphaproteobacteria bacterium]
MALNIVFMGTPDFAVPALVTLIGAGHRVVAVYSQPPRPAGRGLAPRRSPVHERADGFGLPVFTPASLKGEAEQAAFAGHGADLAVVVAYGLILPRPILTSPRLGCYNIHASLLPRWRGAAPIQRAIMAGDRETGVTIMKMEEGLDTGPVALAERLAIGPDMTAGELHDRLAMLGADLIVRALAALERGSLTLTPQPATGATYAAKIDKAETRIDWRRPAQAIRDHIRALSPLPGAWFELPGGERVKVLRAVACVGSGQPGEVLDKGLAVACGQGAVRLERLQRAGRTPVDAEAFLRGFRLAAGTVLA